MNSLKSLQFCRSLPELITGESRLRVHSVFHHACNLFTSQGRMISLQAQNMPLAPRSVILPLDDLRQVVEQGGVLFLLHDNTLALNHLLLELTAGESLSTRLDNVLPQQDLPRLTAAIGHFLARNPPVGGMYDILRGGDGQTLSHISPALAHLQAWLIEADMALCVDISLRQLVGFGIGLTPSADDFILGILLVLDSCRADKYQTLSSLLPSLLTRTTDISAAMLANGCAGHYSHHFSRLVTAPIDDIEQTLKQVAEYGHSSGHDMLCGAHFALAALHA
ncbi:conserved hypothetical protein [Enterobacterales bacterium 8AC]|nr:conserved hypothetical protein [Enterobacterales bacterium 8AC]